MTMQRIIQSDINIIKSIQIHCGDTLWNIAEENMSDDYESVNDYITEVKKRLTNFLLIRFRTVSI